MKKISESYNSDFEHKKEVENYERKDDNLDESLFLLPLQEKHVNSPESLYKSLVSGHIYLDDDGDKEVEIFKLIHEEEDADVFCDIDHALLEQIDSGESKDYFFIAVVESKFVTTHYLECIEHEVEYTVKEITSVQEWRDSRE